jgi:hypothetical protein
MGDQWKRLAARETMINECRKKSGLKMLLEEIIGNLSNTTS